MSQQRSISSTSSQRPALWKPSAGACRRLRERVLELVAVVEDRLGRDDLLERRLLDPAEAAQRVLDLALLLLELRLVREILEAAAAAGGVVRARRLDALRARTRGRRRRAPPRGSASPSSRGRGRGLPEARAARRRRSRSAARRRSRRKRGTRRRARRRRHAGRERPRAHRSHSHPEAPRYAAGGGPRGGGPVALTMSSRCDWRFASIDVSCAAVSLPAATSLSRCAFASA